jgi:hypothetical protein
MSKRGWSGAVVFDDHSPITGAVVFDDRLHVAAPNVGRIRLDLRRWIRVGARARRQIGHAGRYRGPPVGRGVSQEDET